MVFNFLNVVKFKQHELFKKIDDFIISQVWNSIAQTMLLNEVQNMIEKTKFYKEQLLSEFSSDFSELKYDKYEKFIIDNFCDVELAYLFYFSRQLTIMSIIDLSGHSMRPVIGIEKLRNSIRENFNMIRNKMWMTQFYNLDAVYFVEKVLPLISRNRKCMIYCDPPYVYEDNNLKNNMMINKFYLNTNIDYMTNYASNNESQNIQSQSEQDFNYVNRFYTINDFENFVMLINEISKKTKNIYFGISMIKYSTLEDFCKRNGLYLSEVGQIRYSISKGLFTEILITNFNPNNNVKDTSKVCLF
ncbi:MAG: hypothetical protein NZM44_05340, partial [Candidatus Calescibacterium sp.]|nr:hypothetical protein [Candidatus Calescibacterium sp.]